MKNIKKIIYLFLFSLVIISAFLLRSQETLSNNFLFLIDQGRDLMDVKRIVFEHHLTLIGPYTSLGGVFQGPIWYCLLAIPITLTNGNPLSTIVLMLLISMLTLFTVYFFINRWFGRETALITLFLFAISPEAIAAATYSWNPHPMWLVIIIYTSLIYLIKIKSIKYHIVLWPIIALAFHFEAALGFFLLLGTMLFFLLFNRKQFFNKYLFIGFIGVIVLFLPQIIFDIRHNYLMSRSVIDIVAGNSHGLFATDEDKYFNLFSDHINAFYKNYLTSFNLVPFGDFVSKIILLLSLFVLFISIKIRIFSKQEKIFLKLLFSLFISIIISTFIYPFPIRYWHLTGFQTFYLLIVGLEYFRADFL